MGGNEGSIESCTVSGGAISSTSTDENFRAGGVVGYNENGTVSGTYTNDIYNVYSENG